MSLQIKSRHSNAAAEAWFHLGVGKQPRSCLLRVPGKQRARSESAATISKRGRAVERRRVAPGLPADQQHGRQHPGAGGLTTARRVHVERHIAQRVQSAAATHVRPLPVEPYEPDTARCHAGGVLPGAAWWRACLPPATVAAGQA